MADCLINFVTSFPPLVQWCLVTIGGYIDQHNCSGACVNPSDEGGCHLLWNGTNVTLLAVVVTGQVSRGLSDQVRLTRGQVGDDEACTLHTNQAPSNHPRYDLRHAPLFATKVPNAKRF